MFIGHRFGVKDLLKVGTNDLVLYFKAPKREAYKEQEANGGPMTCCESPKTCIWTRKLMKSVQSMDHRRELIRAKRNIIGVSDRLFRLPAVSLLILQQAGIG